MVPPDNHLWSALPTRRMLIKTRQKCTLESSYQQKCKIQNESRQLPVIKVGVFNIEMKRINEIETFKLCIQVWWYSIITFRELIKIIWYSKRTSQIHPNTHRFLNVSLDVFFSVHLRQASLSDGKMNGTGSTLFSKTYFSLTEFQTNNYNTLSQVHPISIPNSGV